MAIEIANQLGDADLLPIELKTTIPESEFWRVVKIGIFNWLGRGMRYFVPKVDVNAYDQIIVGTPVWMGVAALPVLNVVKKLQVNKRVKGLFATCGIDAGIVFSDLCEKTGILPTSNCLTISRASLEDNLLIQNEIKDFVINLNQVDSLKSQVPIHEG